MSEKKLSLKSWIESTGPTKVAYKLKVCESAVRQWHRGYCLPRPEIMRDIKRMTKGRLSYATMIEDHFRKSPKTQTKSSKRA